MSTKRFTVGYGLKTRTFTLDEQASVHVMQARDSEKQTENESSCLEKALQKPIGTPTLDRIVHPGEKICVITSDITRPCPSARILPVLINELNQAGIPDDDITIVLALGIHRRHTEKERRDLVGDDLFARIRTVDSDPDRTVHLGTTRWGTPVNITETVAKADRRICVGNIEYHYFAGYSGGAKALMPGVSDRAAIQANHRRMVEPTARAGAIDDNILRRDLEEAADICGCDFILNVVLDEHKHIVHAVAGDHREAHRAGCMRLDQLYKIPIEAPADLVIASPGGHPKDINLYQSQKALDNAAQAVRSGGVILLVAQCAEGYGERVFSEWLNDARQPEDLIARIQKNFELGGHKAAAIAGVLNRAHIFLVSDMPDEMVLNAFLRPFTNINQAIEEALKIVGQRAKIVFMPYAGSTLPSIKPQA